MIVKRSVKKKTNRLVVLTQGLVLILLLAPYFTLPSTRLTYSNSLLFRPVGMNRILSAEIPTLNISYTSRTNPIDTQVKSGDVIAGDHVVLKAQWTPTLVNRSRLEINAHAIPTLLWLEENQASLEIDTRALGNNASCTITATAWLGNGSIIEDVFTDVYIGNYFIPKVVVTSPNGGEEWTGVHNITWTASDINADDELLFDVFFSSDSGESFESLASLTNLTWFEWDCTELHQSDASLIRVRVSDGIYFSSDISDNVFTAGAIVTTSPTSPTTGPTTTPPELEPRIVVFVIILLFSCGVMALVVYYAARKWL